MQDQEWGETKGWTHERKTEWIVDDDGDRTVLIDQEGGKRETELTIDSYSSHQPP